MTPMCGMAVDCEQDCRKKGCIFVPGQAIWRPVSVRLGLMIVSRLSETVPVASPPVRKGLIRRLYDWTLRVAEGPRAIPILGLVSFAEASFFPVPPDPILMAVALSRPDRAIRAALWCTLMSVLGGLFGYAIGAGLYELVGRPIIEAYRLQDAFAVFRDGFAEWGAWIIVAKGLTPIPFKLVTIAGGVAQMNLPAFVLACALTRGARFLFVAWLFRMYGARARTVIDTHFYPLFWGGMFVLALGVGAVFLF
ncbi:YqaA family protein [Haematospirillum sp. 15-248]|uniref:YqaA family protein n=1 Tax=Haematospirillum sp. 15-248 TaxID=2723107 RepID=UPI001FD74B07|nr:YqaA family protein [Haematospirillum sp. 15-248]